MRQAEREKSESESETLSAADLLDDNGSVDTSAVLSISLSEISIGESPTGAEVTEWRQRLIRGETYHKIAQDADWAAETVRAHAKGEQDCDGEPDCRPVDWAGGDWTVVDDE